MNSPQRRFAIPSRLLVIGAILIALVGLAFLAYSEFIATRKQSEFLPVSLNSQKSARYEADATIIAMPQVRVDIVEGVIQDQDPQADAQTRYSIVQANLLTPVAWLVASPTPTPTATANPIQKPILTPVPTLTPTPGDPWRILGEWRVSCKTDLTLAPIIASKIKFQMISGGGEDNRISFYWGGSSGASFLANGVWQSTIDKPIALRTGDWHETADLYGAVVTRAQFSVGCNDNEDALVRIYYLPVGAATATPTLASTSTATPRPSPSATATSSPTFTPTRTATPSPTATSTPLPTATPTSSPTATSKPTNTPTTVPTSTATRVSATPLPASVRGSIAFHHVENGIDVLNVLNLDQNTVTPLVNIGPVMDLQMGTNAAMGAWSPDDSQFAFISTLVRGGSNILQVVDFKANTTRSLFSSEAGGGLSSPTWSPDGKQIAILRTTANRGTWAIDIINADGSRCSWKIECEIRLRSGSEQYQRGLSWSTQNLFALGMNTTSANEVYIMFVDGNLGQNLTNHPADDGTPVWSPDGKQIAFTSTRDGYNQIYLVNADGAGLRRISRGEFADWSPTWSPDGNWIAFTSDRSSASDIYMMDLNGGNVTRLTKTGGDHPMWSR